MFSVFFNSQNFATFQLKKTSKLDRTSNRRKTLIPSIRRTTSIRSIITSIRNKTSKRKITLIGKTRSLKKNSSMIRKTSWG